MLCIPHTAYTFIHGLKKKKKKDFTGYISLYFSLSKQSKLIKNLFKVNLYHYRDVTGLSQILPISKQKT